MGCLVTKSTTGDGVGCLNAIFFYTHMILNFHQMIAQCCECINYNNTYNSCVVTKLASNFIPWKEHSMGNPDSKQYRYFTDSIILSNIDTSPIV